MKKIFLLLLSFYSSSGITAQLVITPGAQLYIDGNTQLTLLNIDLINNGIFSSGTGIITFSGNAISSIEGSQPLQFYQLEINKIGANPLSLQKAITVSGQINFTSGNIDLNGFNIDLGTTGMLNGEQESSRIIGATGGKVILTTILNAPAAVNPGNLGAIFTSSQNLGNTIIGRGHQSQVNGSGTGNSILRYYDITPDNNSSLNATLRMQYFDNDLNGLSEGSLALYSSTDNIHWTNMGFNTDNTTTNFVEKTNIASFARLTLSGITNALPVRFILFNARCNGTSVLLTWKTAQEQNAHYYSVERSTDGQQWTAIGNAAAAGTTAVENDYSYTDDAALANSYYRVAEYDMDGKTEVTNVLRTSCGNAGAFSVWPNPVSDLLYISLSSAATSNAVVKMYDAKGALVKQQEQKLLQGNNLFNIDVHAIAAGLYYIRIINTAGETQTQKLMKK